MIPQRPLIRVWFSVFLLCQLVMGARVPDDGHEGHDASAFLYKDPTINAPVIEFSSAFASPKDFRTSDKPKVVEFYNPYCGACQAYQPHYLKLAKELKHKKGHEIDIYAVSCQVYKNVCDQYNVDSIPFVGVFKAGKSDPSLLRKLKKREKEATFIIPYLFPENEDGSTTKEGRALDEEEEEEEEEEEQEGNEDNEEEEEENDNNNSDEKEEEENDNNEGGDDETEGGDGDNEDNEDNEENEDGDEEDGEEEYEEDNGNADNEEAEDGEEETDDTNNEEMADGDGGEENTSNEENENKEDVENADGNDDKTGDDKTENEEEDEDDDKERQLVHGDKEDEDEEENDEGGEEAESNEDGEDEQNEDEEEEDDDKERQLVHGEDEKEGWAAADIEAANQDWFLDAAKQRLNMMGKLQDTFPMTDRMSHKQRLDKLDKLSRQDLGRFKRGAPVAGAGAAMKKQVPSDMDKFSAALLKKQGGKLQAGAFGEKVKQENIDKATGATRAMKAHTPGTPEFNERQQKVKTHMDKVIKKKGLRTTAPQKTFSAGAGGVSKFLPANHKPVLPYKKEVQKPKLVHDMAGKVPIVRRMVKLSHEEGLILDASLSFMTALKSGLFTNTDPLPHNKKRAFQTWLDLLRISLPPEWGLHELIMDLDNNIDFVSQSDLNLQKFIRKHELPRHEWSRECTKNGKDKKNGFNCGFWKLLHIITVGIAEHRGGLNLIEGNLISKEARVFSPNEAADAIKDFIGNFFPCTPCKNNFVAAYDECSSRRCVRLTEETEDASFADWQELSKWLWEEHNSVNVRLFREKSEDKSLSIHDDVSVLWPSVETCLSCFGDDGGYDEDGVFLFLEQEYWPGASDIDPAADKLLQFHDVEYAGFAWSWIILFLGVGLMYLLRPKGMFKQGLRAPKTRSD